MTQKTKSMKPGVPNSGLNEDFSKAAWEDLKLNADGLIPVIVQEDCSGEVVMMAYMNREAFEQTVKTHRMTYYSRSRQELWLKGETSGHFQYVHSLYADCDKDTLLARITQVGAACHTGRHSCFFQEIFQEETESQNIPTIL